MTRAARIGLIGLPALCVGLFGGLVAVGARSWLRTAPLRAGGPLPLPRPARTRSSLTTWLAGGAGGAVCMWGLLLVRSGRSLGAIPGAWGAVILVSGVRSRVTAICVDGQRLVVHYASRRPFTITWGDVVALRPPRRPLGGWVLVGRAQRRTLMPSDVLGQERTLGSIVGFARLRFEGGQWVQGP